MTARAVLLLLFLALPARAAEHTVLLGGFAFSPSRLTVRAGDTVRWVNTGGIHNVVAEDGSFSSGEAALDGSAVWPFAHRFDRPGVFPYFCVPHEFHGMRGVVEVEGPDHPGIPELAQARFTVSEGEGAAVITVRRAKGNTGAVSVAYAASTFSPNPGNAQAGADFTAVSGTLEWADGETADRSFTVPVFDDSAVEGDEALSLTLRDPRGGATLDPRSRTATLTILDGDAPAPLTAAEVSCDAARLSGLLARAAVTAAAAPRAGSTGLNVSFTASGDFAGLAYAGGPGTAEHHLAFSTNPEEIPLLRNPARPQLATLSLTRNALNSDLVPRGDAGEVRVTLNPTLGSGVDTLLRLDNLEGPHGAPADAKPGRGLAALLAPCHAPWSARDVHVFRVLTKVARAFAPGAEALELAIFRGEAANAFRLDAYAPTGRLAAELAVTFGTGGEMVGGTLALLPRCTATRTAHCTSVTGMAELALVPPVPSGVPPPAAEARVFTSGVEGDGQPEVPVDWAALLAGTTWRKPL